MNNEIWIKTLEKNKAEMEQDDVIYIKKIASDAHAVFEDNPRGKKFLEFLEAHYLKDIPVADPSLGSDHAFWREGQNSIIRQFREWVNNHKLYKQGDM